MTAKDIEQAVLAAIGEVSGFPADQLAGALDHDLIADLGLDSLKVMQAWAGIETQLGLDKGALAIRQPTTLRAIIEAAKRQHPIHQEPL